MKEFSDRLRDLRHDHDLSQRDLGRAFGLTGSTISGYESENKEPSLTVLCEMARYFGCTADYLLGTSDEPCGRAVLPADNINFYEHLHMAPRPVQSLVSACLRELYLLLDSDVQLSCEDRLSAYAKLLQALQSGRIAVRSAVASASGTASAEVIAAQSELRSGVDSQLDSLLQSDLRQAAPPAQKSSGATAG